MAEYIDREKIHFHAFYDAGDYSQAMRCINNMTPADVIERSRIDNALADMQSMLDQEVLNDNVISDVGQGIAIAMGLLNNELGEDKENE